MAYKAAIVLLLFVMTACSSVKLVEVTKPVTEREYFTRGAMYGCSGIVINMAKIFQVPSTDGLDLQTLLLCRTYAERVTRLVFDTGDVNSEDEPPIIMPSTVDPL